MLDTIKSIIPAFLALLAAFPVRAAEEEQVDVQYSGAGWIQFGRIEHSSDTVFNAADNNFNDNWNQNTGGQITAAVKINENWEGGLGLGAIQGHGSRGALGVAHIWAPSWAPYVTEARATYTRLLGADGNKLQLTLGSFPYNYSGDAKNLGMYLLRGHVYPGTVISGFETKHVLPIASIFGGMASFRTERFRNDFIVNSETDSKPFFDFSFANIASFKVAPGFEIGAGVNFYRALAQNASVTTPSKECGSDSSGYGLNSVTINNREACYSLDTVSYTVQQMDTTLLDPSKAGTSEGVLRITRVLVPGSLKVDTITGSMAGVKMMARFRMDPKTWLGAGPFGKEDLVLYGEAAILGVKDYRGYFEKISERIPVMIGVNLPAFGILDNLSLEVEYYGSKNHSDYGKAESYSSWVPRAPGSLAVKSGQSIPFGGFTYDKIQVMRVPDNSEDDWKWSLYASRLMLGHLKVSGQVANDHLRPGGYGLQPTWSEALTTLEDWYWMLKVAYFF